ncbi:MAG: aa3-type cytochrome c oxidase subunit IV [Pseudorhodoplanes sp.]|nr:aa3-type cytochrome c oxidase subunit IV [Pseudorhodoplanes sp.]MCZ7641671.1 aa3-type cytochrome c oxidase subunit IV [Pseudorhodoplanes sp.]
MADHGEIQYSTADGNDYLEHEHTYRLFLQLAKWGVIITAVVLALMAYFLV